MLCVACYSAGIGDTGRVPEISSYCCKTTRLMGTSKNERDFPMKLRASK